MYCLGQKKRAELEEQKKKAMEEAERKRQEASDGKGKGKGPAIDAHKEISKTKEQVEEEMKISLSFRIKPLDLEAMDSDELKDKATELFNTILLLETEKYDCEQRRVNQDYELKELKERQKVQLRQKAAKKGLDPEAFTGKYPPRIRMFSKYERRTDTRTYADRKGLYEGGWEVVRAEMLEAQFKEKLDEWNKRTKSRLPRWFGERPGKKAGAPDTPEGEEDEGRGCSGRGSVRGGGGRGKLRRGGRVMQISFIIPMFVSKTKNKNHVFLYGVPLRRFLLAI